MSDFGCLSVVEIEGEHYVLIGQDIKGSDYYGDAAILITAPFGNTRLKIWGGLSEKFVEIQNPRRMSSGLETTVMNDRTNGKTECEHCSDLYYSGYPLVEVRLGLATALDRVFEKKGKMQLVCWDIINRKYVTHSLLGGPRITLCECYGDMFEAIRDLVGHVYIDKDGEWHEFGPGEATKWTQVRESTYSALADSHMEQRASDAQDSAIENLVAQTKALLPGEFISDDDVDSDDPRKLFELVSRRVARTSVQNVGGITILKKDRFRHGPEVPIITATEMFS